MNEMTTAERPRRWSFSQLDDYTTCAYKYKLKRVDRVPSVVYCNAVAGSAFHAWTEEQDLLQLDVITHADDWPTLLDMQVEYEEQKSGTPRDRWSISGKRTAKTPDKESYEYWRDELGPELCAKYIEWRDESDLEIARDLPPDENGRTVGVEYKTSAMVGGTEVLGVIDRVMVDMDGSIGAVDIKAGARKQTTIQLPTYMAALRARGVNATWGSIYYARKGALDEPSNYVNWQEQNLAVPYDTAREQQARGEYPPRPSADCGWCSVRYFCKFRLK